MLGPILKFLRVCNWKTMTEKGAWIRAGSEKHIFLDYLDFFKCGPWTLRRRFNFTKGLQGSLVTWLPLYLLIFLLWVFFPHKCHIEFLGIHIFFSKSRIWKLDLWRIFCTHKVQLFKCPEFRYSIHSRTSPVPV